MSDQYPRVVKWRKLTHPEWSGNLRAYVDVALSASDTLTHCRILAWKDEYYAELPNGILEKERVEQLSELLKAQIKAVMMTAWRERLSGQVVKPDPEPAVSLL